MGWSRLVHKNLIAGKAWSILSTNVCPKSICKCRDGPDIITVSRDDGRVPERIFRRLAAMPQRRGDTQVAQAYNAAK